MGRAIALSREIANAELALALAAFARTSSLMGVALVLLADAVIRIGLPILSRIEEFLA